MLPLFLHLLAIFNSPLPLTLSHTHSLPSSPGFFVLTFFNSPLLPSSTLLFYFLVSRFFLFFLYLSFICFFFQTLVFSLTPSLTPSSHAIPPASLSLPLSRLSLSLYFQPFAFFSNCLSPPHHPPSILLLPRFFQHFNDLPFFLTFIYTRLACLPATSRAFCILEAHRRSISIFASTPLSLPPSEPHSQIP